MLPLFFVSFSTVVFFAYRLYRYEVKSHDYCVGEMIGFEDYFYVDACDVIVLENNLGVNETICFETVN